MIWGTCGSGNPVYGVTQDGRVEGPCQLLLKATGAPPECRAWQVRDLRPSGSPQAPNRCPNLQPELCTLQGHCWLVPVL